jgi:5'-nucleotidase
MPLNLSDTLLIGTSSTALLDLSEADKIFRETYNLNSDIAIENYRRHVMDKEELPLGTGTG